LTRPDAYDPAWLAAADGVTDDAAALDEMFAALPEGAIVDGRGRTYRVDSPITAIKSRQAFRNARLSLESAGSGAKAVSLTNTSGDVLLTSSLTRAATTITVAGLSVGDLLFQRSLDEWAQSGDVSSEWLVVDYVSGSTVVFANRVLGTYTTSPELFKPAVKTDITFDDVEIIGSVATDDQWGWQFHNCARISLFNVRSLDVGERLIQFDRVYDVTVDGWRCERANALAPSGLGYGVVVSGGTQKALIKGGKASRTRHAVTVGGTSGVDRDVIVRDNFCDACYDGGVDTHPGCTDVSILDNIVDCYTTSAANSGTGITAQGARQTIRGNKIRNVIGGAGILAQPLTRLNNDRLIIQSNEIEEVFTSGQSMIAVSNQKPAGAIRGIDVSGNIGRSSDTGIKGITIEGTASGGLIENVSLNGNSMNCHAEALSLVARTGIIMQYSGVLGGVYRTASTAVPAVSLYSESGGSYGQVGVITGVNAVGGSYSFANASANPFGRMSLVGCRGFNFTTAFTSGSFDLSGNFSG
ncbi:MAG: hypothetical protein AAFX58_13590, partial [Pseudomonadota bacterium]